MPTTHFLTFFRKSAQKITQKTCIIFFLNVEKQTLNLFFIFQEIKIELKSTKKTNKKRILYLKIVFFSKKNAKNICFNK